MIQGFLFDFDNTIYDYDLANKAGLDKIFNYLHLTFKIDLNIISNTFNKINHNIKSSNNYAIKFNKSIYFKQLLEEIGIGLSNLDIVLDIYNNEFNNNLVVVLQRVNPP